MQIYDYGKITLITPSMWHKLHFFEALYSRGVNCFELDSEARSIVCLHLHAVVLTILFLILFLLFIQWVRRLLIGTIHDSNTWFPFKWEWYFVSVYKHCDLDCNSVITKTTTNTSPDGRIFSIWLDAKFT